MPMILSRRHLEKISGGGWCEEREESEERGESEEREENTGMAIDVRHRLDVSPGIKGRSGCNGETWRNDNVRGSWGLIAHVVVVVVSHLHYTNDSSRRTGVGEASVAGIDGLTLVNGKGGKVVSGVVTSVKTKSE